MSVEEGTALTTAPKLNRSPSERFKVLGWMVLALKRWQSEWKNGAAGEQLPPPACGEALARRRGPPGP